jgi:hypothetical protein
MITPQTACAAVRLPCPGAAAPPVQRCSFFLPVKQGSSSHRQGVDTLLHTPSEEQCGVLRRQSGCRHSVYTGGLSMAAGFVFDHELHLLLFCVMTIRKIYPGRAICFVFSARPDTSFFSMTIRKMPSVQIVQNAFFLMVVYCGFAPNPILFLQKERQKLL